MTLPKRLPKKPRGWKRSMRLHLNFGRDGGAANFAVFDAHGNEMPIGYQYDTRKGGKNGFTLPGVDAVLTWDELRAEWPAFLKRRPTPPAGEVER